MSLLRSAEPASNQRPVRPAAIALLAVWAVVFLAVSSLQAQQVLLDAGVQAGELMVFPTLGRDLEPGSDYYYVPARARLARDQQGRPQFSFLRYSDVDRPDDGEETAREGEGGGIVHAVVELAVDDNEVRRAENELGRLRPGARIVGPVIYRSGTFGLVSSFLEENGELTHRVVGLGSAPVLEGSRAAISMRLTKLGAKILWESFEMPTPDISFVFEMEVEGLRAPQRARLEADWDRIYKHQAFQAGVAGTLLAGEVSAAFDDLRDQGAIRMVQVGDDAQMDKLVQIAYDRLTKLMLEPIEGTGTPSLGALAGGGGLLDRATKMLAAARSEAAKAQTTVAKTPTAKPATHSPKPSTAKPDDDPDAEHKPSATPNEPKEPPAKIEEPAKPDADNAARTTTTEKEQLQAETPSAETPSTDKDLEPGADDPRPQNLKLAYWAAIEDAEANSLEEVNQRVQTEHLQENRSTLVEMATWREQESGTDMGLVADALYATQTKVLEHWENRWERFARRIADKRASAQRTRANLAEPVIWIANDDPKTAELGRFRAELDYLQAEVGATDIILEELEIFADDHPDLASDAQDHLTRKLREAAEFRTEHLDEIDLLQEQKLSFEESIGLFADLPRDSGISAPSEDEVSRSDTAAGEAPQRVGTSSPATSVTDPESDTGGDASAGSSSGSGTSKSELSLIDSPADAASITNDDLWIVSLGDSFSSGEGNPTTTGVPINAWKWMDDEKCNRSKWGWPHVTAEKVAEYLRRRVRFSFLACSGAELQQGLLESFTDRDVNREPQLDRLKSLIAAAGRPPDFVLMTGGGNDVGFADVVIECITPGDCPGAEATDLVNSRIDMLGGDNGSYARVAGRLKEMKIPPERVLLMMYPDPLVGRKRKGSGWGPTEVQAGCYLPAGSKMWAWASQNVVVPLQDVQRDSAAALGWRLVENHLSEFSKHSYCPRDSFRGGDSWWVGILSQIVKQWGLGAFHPNRRGHRELARAAIGELADAIPGLPKPRPRVEEPVATRTATASGGPGSPGGSGSAGTSVSQPSFAFVAAMQLRKVRQRGTFELDMSKYMAGAQTIKFDQPIGDLRRYKDDDAFFRQISLDQLIFRQREVNFQLVGLNAEDFGDYVNFVSVQLRRGESVREEHTVGADEFNQRGDIFGLIYGFSGEETRDEWNRYEYRTVWSLFRGLRVEEPWQETTDDTVALAPPYLRRTVDLEGDPEKLDGIRAITVKLYYSVGEEERFSETLLRPDRGETVGAADVLLPEGETTYDYEILWQSGNQPALSSGRQTTSNPILLLNPPTE